MFNNGNGFNRPKSRSGWWQAWRNPGGEREGDLSSYRRLAVQLHHTLPREADVSRSVLIVTPNEPRFWASSCVTLASCIAEELSRPVLLAALYDSGGSSVLDGSPEAGLAEVLHDPHQSIEELAMQTSQSNLWFLPPGNTEDLPLSISLDNVASVLARAAEHWDFVVIGGGPVLSNSAVLALSPFVGRVLILAIENRTQLEDIDTAYAALQQCGAENVGLVLTEADEGSG